MDSSGAAPQEQIPSFMQDHITGESVIPESPGLSSPTELVLDVRRTAAIEPRPGFFEELSARLSSLQRLEIVADAPLASTTVHRVLQYLRESVAGSPTPSLLLRGRTLGDPDEARGLLAGIPRVTVRLDFEGQPDLGELQRCADLSRRGEFALEIGLLVGPSNWYEVGPLAALCEQAQAHLRLATQDAEGRCPLSHLPLEEIHFVCLALEVDRERFAGPEPCASVSLQDYDLFLEECRSIHLERTERALKGDATEAAGSAELHLPPVTHCAFRDEASTIALLRLLGCIVHSPAVGAWIHQVVSAPNFVEHAQGRFSLRWLALWGEAIFHDPAALGALRAIYGEEGTRDRLLLEDRTETARLALENSVGIWARHHGLDKATARKPPFEVPSIIQRPTPSWSADITVLIPSYNHEAYVETALRSVLAQTYTDFHVLVVDDCSSDATVERVKRIADERVRVVVRPRNLGLGNNVLDALTEVRTPYAAILNSDDVFHPERLERCRRALEERHEAVIAATGVALVDAHGGSLTPDSTVPLLDGTEITDWVSWYFGVLQNVARARSFVGALLQHNFLITSSNIFSRTSFLRGRADALRNLKYCLDWQLFLDAALEDALVYLPEELVAYRLHPRNTVWFREGGRWSFYLEVNRVVARGVRRLVERADGKALDRVLEVLVEHVTHNTEVDGWALFLQTLLGEVDFEEAAAASPQVRKLLGELERCAKERQTAIYRVAKGQHGSEEINRVYASREWQIGNLLWNQIGLSKVARPVARKMRRLQGWLGQRRRVVAAVKLAGSWLRGPISLMPTRPVSRFRRRLALARARRWPSTARRRAVVTSCPAFPLYFHTFVYQEMQALQWMGFGVKVFCWEANPRDRNAAFHDLWRNRVVVPSHWAIHQEDLAHFRGARPERVESFLELVAGETGLAKETLIRDWDVLAGFTFARHVEAAEADYLHSYFFYDQSFMAMMAAYLLGVPRGITAYADHMLTDYRLKCVRLHLQLADVVVATSQRIKDELSAVGGGRFDDKILVKPNGVDPSRFSYVERAAHLPAGVEPELITVSRIDAKKGLIYLAEAIRILADRGVGVRANLVGSVDPYSRASAEYAEELTAKVRELGITDRLVMHGVKKQSDLLPLLARSCVLVAPYVELDSGDKDGIPTAVLEAMSTGLPVVTTDAGSILEAVTDGVEAICVPQRDPVRLADAIERLVRDPALCRRMGESGRRRVEAEFNVEVTERRLHERIEALLHRSGSR